MKPFLSNIKLHSIVIFAVSFLLYANTLGHEYTQDDAIVIYDNMYTQQGLQGIPGLLTKDTFFGFFKKEGKAKLVSGGRYRPLTPVMFAVEWQLFGKKPWVGHLLNVLFFGLLCMMIYSLNHALFKPILNDKTAVFSLVAALLFAAHPIHTEVVANIKGRDEIMSMIGAVGAFIFVLKYIDKVKMSSLLIAFVLFFLGLMSKENTITYLAVIGLGVWMFRTKNRGKLLMPMMALLGATAVFLLIRTSVLGFDFGATSTELMNNPYLKWNGNKYIPFSGAEKMATIAFTLGIYLKLLVLPHPLIHDYYPRHIDIMSFGDLGVILSILANVVLLVIAIYYFKKKRLISYSIFYYFFCLSIVSNIVFPIGTNMSERFLFMPSLGFCWIIAWLFIQFSPKKQAIVSAILGFFLGFYSFKTVVRNFDWKNDYTLFTTDVKKTTRSAKLLNAAGGALSTEASKMDKGAKRTKMLKEAIEHLTKATEIHPTYKNAFLLRANSQYWLGNYPEAALDYEKALQIDPGYQAAMDNLPLALRDAGRHFGEVEKDYQKALNYLKQAITLNPEDAETNRLLGISYGLRQDHSNAIKYFKKVVDLDPKIAQSYVNVGIAYRNAGDNATSDEWFAKATAIDPNALKQFSQ